MPYLLKKQLTTTFEALLVDAILSIDEGVAIYDDEDRLVLVNPVFKHIFPSTAEIIPDKPHFRDLVTWAFEHGDFIIQGLTFEEWYKYRTQVRNQGLPIEYLLKDGRIIRGVSQYTGPKNMVTVFTDITFQKQKEEALINAKTLAESANRTKSAFLAHVSHELRTPLNAIMGFSEIMSKSLFGPIDNPQYEGYVKDILKSGQHLLGIIDDLLEVAKAEMGQLDLRESEFNFSDIVQDVYRMSLLRAETSKIQLMVSLNSHINSFCGDERKIRQILLNLVTNALKFTPSGGSVHIGFDFTNHGDGLLTITDTGSGIPKDEIPKVMEAFGRIDNPFSRSQHEGTGLGLHLTDTFVRLHGGTLEIQSAVDEGTTVSVLLPKDRFKDSTPGSERPSSHSKKAPPADET